MPTVVAADVLEEVLRPGGNSVPHAKIVEVVEFESQDPAFRGEMRITASFADVDERTEVAMLFENTTQRNSLGRQRARLEILSRKPGSSIADCHNPKCNSDQW